MTVDDVDVGGVCAIDQQRLHAVVAGWLMSVRDGVRGCGSEMLMRLHGRSDVSKFGIPVVGRAKFSSIISC